VIFDPDGSEQQQVNFGVICAVAAATSDALQSLPNYFDTACFVFGDQNQLLYVYQKNCQLNHILFWSGMLTQDDSGQQLPVGKMKRGSVWHVPPCFSGFAAYESYHFKTTDTVLCSKKSIL